MSRRRFNSALLVSAMVNNVLEAPIDPDTGMAMRKVQMQSFFKKPAVSDKPGCRTTFCREKKRCHCRCKKCRMECTLRDVEVIEDGERVHFKHSDGAEALPSMSKDEYEEQKKLLESLDVDAAFKRPFLKREPLVADEDLEIDDGVTPGEHT